MILMMISKKSCEKSGVSKTHRNSDTTITRTLQDTTSTNNKDQFQNVCSFSLYSDSIPKYRVGWSVTQYVPKYLSIISPVSHKDT